MIEYSYAAMNLDPTQGKVENAIPTTGEKGVGIYRLTNNITKEFQFVNFPDSPGDLRPDLGNGLNWNLIPTNTTQGRWATSNIIGSLEFNPDSIHNLKGGDPIPITRNYILEDISKEILNDGKNQVKYDIIKIHILSGYNLEGVDGFILDVSFLESSKKKTKVSTAAYLRNNTFQKPTFNPNPIMMGERMYDKYLTIYVPSLYKVQQELTTNKRSLANLFSHPVIPDSTTLLPGGFLKGSTIYLTLKEILYEETKDKVDFYTIKNSVETTVNPADTYSFLSCTIRESELGDFFEYFPTWQGEFLDDYITFLNSTQGYGWTVIHNIKVVEQIGSQFFTTSDLTIPQSSDFTKPSYFRPIILRSGEAFAFSLLYTMRLFNTNTGEQVLRVASVTSHEPKKYGLSSKRIKIDEGIQPFNVYNKIVNETLTPTSFGITRTENMFTTKFIPTYIDRRMIAVNMTNSVAPQLDTVIYGQGKCHIQLTKFDNVFKFVVLNIEGTSTLPMNLSGSKIFMKFVQDNDQDITIKQITSEDVQGNMGELVFNIMKEDAIKILKIKNDKSFYIVIKQDNSSMETVIYSGTFDKFVKGVEIDEETAKPLEIKLNEEQEKIDRLEEEYKEKLAELEVLLENNEQLRENLNEEIESYRRRLEPEISVVDDTIDVTGNLSDREARMDERETRPLIHPLIPEVVANSDINIGTSIATTNPIRFITPVSVSAQNKPDIFIAQPPPTVTTIATTTSTQNNAK